MNAIFVTVLFVSWLEHILAFNLTILHTNDVHARFEEFNKRITDCKASDITKNTCFGGAARRKTALDDIRSRYQNTIFVDGGDQYQGTLWYSVFKWGPVAKIMKHLGYEAMAFGNHEFDDGLDGLVPFLENITQFPIINSNIRTVGSPLEGLYVKSFIKVINGESIGIVGYTTKETANISYPGKTLVFEDEITSLKSTVSELISDGGVNKVLAIGHAGIGKDREICKKVPGIDVVVGGHTNTFLYTGTPPSNDVPEGPYPEVYKDTGKPCLVVQDYAFGKYLGFLEVEFDSSGVAQSWSGNPILLDNRYAEDSETLDMLDVYKAKLEKYKTTVIGRTGVSINGSTKACRLGECNLGNLLTDAAIFYQMNTDPDSEYWTKASICLWNGGGMRDFLADAWDNITLSDLSSIMPFGNMIERIQLSGENIRKSLEHSVSDISVSDPRGRFLQMAGLKVVYDLSKPEGERVLSVRARCSKCKIPRYEPLKDDEVYDVVTSSYLLDGGDGHIHMEKYTFRDNAELLDLDMARKYFDTFDPVLPQLEDRIRFVSGSASSCFQQLGTPTSAASTLHLHFQCGGVLLLALLLVMSNLFCAM